MIYILSNFFFLIFFFKTKKHLFIFILNYFCHVFHAHYFRDCKINMTVILYLFIEYKLLYINDLKIIKTNEYF